MPLCVAAIYVDICRQGAPAAAQYVDKAHTHRQQSVDKEHQQEYVDKEH